MESPVVARLLAILWITLTVFHFSWKAYQKRHEPNQGMVITFTLALLSILISLVFATPAENTWLNRAIFEYTLIQAGVFTYFGLDQLLNLKPYRRVWTTRLFWGTTVASLAVTVLNYFQQDNLASFGDGQTYCPTWSYYAAYLANYAILGFVVIAIVRLYLRNIRQQYINLPYFVRRIICMSAFGNLLIFCIVLMIVNLILSIFYGETYRATLNKIYFASMGLGIVLMTIGFVTPHKVFAAIVAPIEKQITAYQERRKALLAYLHNRLICLAPHVELKNEFLRPYRLLIEISDARQMIWSHTKYPSPITPQEEARFLFNLLAQGATFSNTAEHIAPRSRSKDITRHYVALAKQLQRLEELQKKASAAS